MMTAPWSDAQDRLVAAKRAIALAGPEPEARLSELAAQARALAVDEREGLIAGYEIVDELSDAASANGLIEAFGADEVQHVIADALDESVNGAEHNPPPPQGPEDYGLPDEPPTRVAGKPALEPLPFIDLSEWEGKAPPRQCWSVRDRIPLRQPALLSGEGAIGKTRLALQLCVAHVLSRDWLGMLPEPGPAIYLGAEDDADQLHRVIGSIAEHYGASFADLKAGGLHLLSLAGQDALLGVANRNGTVEPTPLFTRLHQAVRDIQPKTLVIDPSADVFGGNENDRTQVRQFVGLGRKLAIDGNSSVLLNSHPSLTGISTGTGLSGSTGWHNSVRARMYFKPATTDQGEEPDPELRELVFLKNNYGPLADRVLLRWRNGVFVPEPGTGSLERAAAEAKADNLFLELLARFNAQGRYVNDRTGRAYAPVLFADEPEAKAAKIRKLDLADAMRRLFATNRIRIDQYGRPSRPSYRIITT